MKDPRIDKLPKWAQKLLNQKDNAIERISLELAATKSIAQPVTPDVPPPVNFGELTKGWHYVVFNNEFRIEPGCSSTTSHGIGDTKQTRSQNSKAFYSTRLRALQAALYELERQHTETQVKIQREINREKFNPTPLP